MSRLFSERVGIRNNKCDFILPAGVYVVVLRSTFRISITESQCSVYIKRGKLQK